MNRRISLLILLIVTAGACGKSSEDAAAGHLRNGDVFLEQKDYANAVIEYSNAVKQDKASGIARFKLAEALVGAGRDGAALAEYVRAADLLPDDPKAQLKAAGALLLTGQFEDARSRAQRVVDREPSNIEALVLLGSATAGMKNLPDAIAKLEEALKFDPGNALTYANLATLQLATGAKATAKATFEKAVQVDPRSVLAWLSLAQFLLATGEIAQARAGAEVCLGDRSNRQAHESRVGGGLLGVGTGAAGGVASQELGGQRWRCRIATRAGGFLHHAASRR